MSLKNETFRCHVALANFARAMIRAGLVPASVYRRVAEVDFEIQRRSLPCLLPAASSPVALLPAPSVEVGDSVAPPMETVLCLRFLAYSMDIDSLADEDAVDLQKERDWCDYWYSWHASQLDAS